MNPAGCLLDTGPLVALLNRRDQYHQKTKEILANIQAPFYTCEAVLAEACFLASKLNPEAACEVLTLGRKGFYQVNFQVSKHLDRIENLFRKYQKVPISLADACLIVCAEISGQAKIFTFDSDFRIYRWGKNKHFQILG